MRGYKSVKPYPLERPFNLNHLGPVLKRQIHQFRQILPRTFSYRVHPHPRTAQKCLLPTPPPIVRISILVLWLCIPYPSLRVVLVIFCCKLLYLLVVSACVVLF